MAEVTWCTSWSELEQLFLQVDADVGNLQLLIDEELAPLKQADDFAALVYDERSVLTRMIVFALGAVISLSTGSSYGTFAILMSIAVPVGFELGASMYLTIAAVLSGGLFGDHVSPISDTTVLVSAGAECGHLNHVTTQAAYAGITGLVALFAYGLAGAYETPLVLVIAIAILFITMTVAMRLFGSRV